MNLKTSGLAAAIALALLPLARRELKPPPPRQQTPHLPRFEQHVYEPAEDRWLRWPLYRDAAWFGAPCGAVQKDSRHKSMWGPP